MSAACLAVSPGGLGASVEFFKPSGRPCCHDGGGGGAIGACVGCVCGAGVDCTACGCASCGCTSSGCAASGPACISANAAIDPTVPSHRHARLFACVV